MAPWYRTRLRQGFGGQARAPAHPRTSAPAHGAPARQRTRAPAHLRTAHPRTSAPARQRTRAPEHPRTRLVYFARVDFRYLAIEGPIGLGKTALAERIGARLDATVVLDEGENPFLDAFYEGRPGAAFQSQLFYTLQRHRQQLALRQGDLFSQTVVADYLFDRDRIYAFMNLDDNELSIYQRPYELLARGLAQPYRVIYLQTPTDVLRRRIKERARRHPDAGGTTPGDDYLVELNEAYTHFFFHYTATPLLVVETSQFDLSWGDEALDDLLRQIQSMTAGTRYYVPRTSSGA